MYGSLQSLCHENAGYVSLNAGTGEDDLELPQLLDGAGVVPAVELGLAGHPASQPGHVHLQGELLQSDWFTFMSRIDPRSCYASSLMP